MTDAESAEIVDRYIRPAAAATREQIIVSLVSLGIARAEAEALLADAVSRIRISAGVRFPK